MATTGFGLCLIVAVFVVILMAAKNYENINIYDWTIVLLIPIVILGYWLKSRVTTSEAAEMAFCFIYLDSTVLLMVSFFAMTHTFGLHVKARYKLLGYGIALIHAAVVWVSFGTNLYYRSLTVTVKDAGSVTKMTSGPLKIIHLIYLIIVMGAIAGTMIVMYFKKGTHSRKLLHNYSFMAALFVIVYAAECAINVDFSLLPYLYAAASVYIAVNYDHMHLHDISSIVSQQQKYSNRRGYVALNRQLDFMSCNERAFAFVPFLEKQYVDEKLPEGEKFFSDMLTKYKKDGTVSKKFSVGDMVCICEISEISFRRDGKIQGYLFDFRDATEEQRTLDIMKSYNETLSAEVTQKTQNIVDIQRKITIGMANIIENRDDNTGGHVKRTSDVMAVLVEEIQKRGNLKVDEQLAEDIVRAAPMHDLGKISVDTSILCKQGRLTDEEYAIMKLHAEKSGEMVHILLDGVEEEHFVNVAFNIARYHHERWDGKGYPEGLVGSMIPIEARLMAVADVYDALVSTRCYKKAMGFQEAKEIMLEGMGSQFDPNLRGIFLSCVDRLEKYYQSLL